MGSQDRTQIAKAAAAGLARFAQRVPQCPVTIGFDGFVDSIIEVVETREDAQRYTTVPTIARFGEKISRAAGQSSNYELVTKLEKLGGNGPIMGNALTAIGLPTTYIGALGYPDVHPVFHDFAKVAQVYSLAGPGLTDALEFEDGKLMFGKLQTLGDVNWERMIQVIGEERIQATFSESYLIGGTNWTMLPRMNDIYRRLIKDILPKLPALPDCRRRIVFVDLADPEKRTREDLKNVIALLADFQPHADMTFGMNLKEATQVAQVLGIEVPGDAEAGIESMAAAIREAMNIQTVVIHPRAGAAAATLTADGVRTASFQGPFVKQPKLSTGAGDNFNAGFCLGLLAQLPIEQVLAVGTATSGFYVREARSPHLRELADFCDNLPAAQA